MNKGTPGEVPQKHPKLEMAALEILEILERHDIACTGFLFLPGNIKPINHISPSWSVVSMSPTHILRINPPLVDPLNEQASQQKIVDTVNMLGNFRIYLGQTTMTMTRAEIQVREHFGMKPPPPQNINQNGQLGSHKN